MDAQPETPAPNPLALKFPDLAPLFGKLQWGAIPFEEVPDDRAALAVMGESGDTKTIWDPEKPVEVEAARDLYQRLTRKGYRAFQVVGKDGTQGEQMDGFDPKAGRMILVPPMQGG